MRVGLISDVHANLPALKAVLADMPPVDLIACAGDVVGYNPWPGACIDRLREREVRTILGNHERQLLLGETFRFNEMAGAGIEHARSQLSDDQREWLESLPVERTVADGRVKLVHGHPDEPDRYTYQEDVSAGLLGEESVCCFGHTHVQHVDRFGEGIVVNPGSVGQPRDGDPRAAYAVCDLDAMTVETHRTRYDIERVRLGIAEAGLPERTGNRLLRGE